MGEGRVTASIIIPTYNRPEMLTHAVRSALAALPGAGAGEVIVTDDGDVSAAETLAGIGHPSLRVTVNRGAKGAAANRNHAARVAFGDVIFFLDDDDLLYPDYPARVLGAREAHGAVWGFSATDAHDGATTSVEAKPASAGFAVLTSGPFRKRLSGLGCGFWIDRKVFLRSGGIREELPVNEDTDFCIALLAAGYAPLYSASPGVSLHRGAPDSLTTSAAPEVRAACFRSILDRHGDFLGKHPDGLTFVLRRYLKFAARAGQFSEALAAARTIGPAGSRAGNLATVAFHALFRPRN